MNPQAKPHQPGQGYRMNAERITTSPFKGEAGRGIG